MNDHDGGADIDTLVGLYDCVRELRDERDRLRAVVEGDRELRVRLAGARCARDEAIAERDRLRAVVDALRETASTVAEATNESPYEKGNAAAWRHVLHAVGQLDVSPTMGGDDG